jgi:fructuronate reductase
VSPDPLYESLSSALSGIRLGQKGPFRRQLEPILSDSGIFGLDLYRAGCGELVESYFEELISGPGAVRRTLKRLTGSR